MKTAEFVTPKHPDKRCDQIADAILDAYMKKDPEARVAVEVLGGHKRLSVTGEVTAEVGLNIKEVITGLVPEDFSLQVNVTTQSTEIADGVNAGGAGDQGIMVGYATQTTRTRMPREYELARRLCYKLYQKFPYDGKVQVTLNEDLETVHVVASFQNTASEDLRAAVAEEVTAENFHINPAGDWSVGGFAADSGLSGRKIVVDSYGPEVPVGGGAFSGKDPTKVDRSGAYMARKIALDYLDKYDAKEVKTRLAYAIGEPHELMAQAIVDGRLVQIDDYDLRPQAIINTLDLCRPIHQKTARWGHFGRNFSWDINDSFI